MNKKELNQIENMINENLKENANIAFSNNFIELQFNNYIQKELAKMELDKIDKQIFKSHEKGDIHIHDLGFFITRPNCLQHPIYKIFLKGLHALNVNSKPAKHLDTALSHALNVINIVQSLMAGGQSIPMFNVWIAPFCKGLSDKEIKQCIQQFMFQLNQISPSRGLQPAFTSLNFEFEIPDFMKHKKVKYKEGKFGDYEKELKRFTKIFLEVLNEGDANGKPFLFPNVIFYVRKDKVDNELLNLVIKNMVEKSNTYLLNGFKYGKKLATSMGCRTYLDDTPTENMFRDVFGTGNLSYVTINLPRIALKYVNNEIDDIEKELDRLIELCIKCLLVKRKIIWDNWNKGMYPFVSNPIYKDKNGYYYNIGYTTMSIGIIGLQDMKYILKQYGINFDEYEFIKKMKQKIDSLNKFKYKELAEKYGIKEYKAYDKEISRWSLIGSPAEGCSYRFKKLDNERYEEILKNLGIYDRKYWTNSVFVPEEEKILGHEKVVREAKYHPFLNGGIICHLWNATTPKKNYLGLGRYLIELLKKTDVRYITISNTIIYCEKCKTSYVGRKDESKCKKCGNEQIKKMTKITGYLSVVEDRFNEGKVDEFNRRNEFKL